MDPRRSPLAGWFSDCSQRAVGRAVLSLALEPYDGPGSVGKEGLERETVHLAIFQKQTAANTSLATSFRRILSRPDVSVGRPARCGVRPQGGRMSADSLRVCRSIARGGREEVQRKTCGGSAGWIALHQRKPLHNTTFTLRNQALTWFNLPTVTYYPSAKKKEKYSRAHASDPIESSHSIQISPRFRSHHHPQAPLRCFLYIHTHTTPRLPPAAPACS